LSEVTEGKRRKDMTERKAKVEHWRSKERKRRNGQREGRRRERVDNAREVGSTASRR
jgi:hypothetical protein